MLTSSKGVPFSQSTATKWSKLQSLIIICGHYEGVDERVAQHLVDLEVRIGEFVLTGGEPAAAVIVDVQNTLVINAILRWATPAQKQRFLPRLATDTVASYALSEAGSGSDAFALTTHAKDHGDHFRINGRKLWITNAAEAVLFLLFATTDPDAGYMGITCFHLDRNTPGFQIGKYEDKLGIRASSTSEHVIDNCLVSS